MHTNIEVFEWSYTCNGFIVTLLSWDEIKYIITFHFYIASYINRVPKAPEYPLIELKGYVCQGTQYGVEVREGAVPEKKWITGY